MLISTEKGLVLITGCAHQGIAEILEEIKETREQSFYMILGGFHFKDMNIDEVNKNLKLMQKFQVRHPAPCHCTGDNAIVKFYEEYGSAFIRIGVGRIIEV